MQTLRRILPLFEDTMETKFNEIKSSLLLDLTARRNLRLLTFYAEFRSEVQQLYRALEEYGEEMEGAIRRNVFTFKNLLQLLENLVSDTVLIPRELNQLVSRK